MVRKKKPLLPDRIRERMPAPDRRRDNKVTARFTEEEFEILAKLSEEREEKISSLVRNLVLATVYEVQEKLKKH